MDEHPRRQRRQHPVEQHIHVAARHEHVARIDGQDVAGPERGEDARVDLLHGAAQQLDGQAGEAGARRRIDRGEPRLQAAVARRRGQEPGRVAGAHLDDAPGPKAPDQGVGDGPVEAREPPLGPARRRRRLGPDPSEIRAQLIGPGQDLAAGRGAPGQARLGGRIGRPRAGRRDAAGGAVGNEEAAPGQAAQRQEAEPQPAPPGPRRVRCRAGLGGAGGRGALLAPGRARRARGRHGLSTSPSRATKVPGRACSASQETWSMKASSCVGS